MELLARIDRFFRNANPNSVDELFRLLPSEMFLTQNGTIEHSQKVGKEIPRIFPKLEKKTFFERENTFFV